MLKENVKMFDRTNIPYDIEGLPQVKYFPASLMTLSMFDLFTYVVVGASPSPSSKV